MRIKGFPNFYQTKVTPTSHHNLALNFRKSFPKNFSERFSGSPSLGKTSHVHTKLKRVLSMLKILLSICPITEGDSSPSVLSDSRSKSNSETNQLGILRWSGARFTAVFKPSFTWPHCLIFPLKITYTIFGWRSMDFLEFLHLGNSTSSCYNLHSTEQNLTWSFPQASYPLLSPIHRKAGLCETLGAWLRMNRTPVWTEAWRHPCFGGSLCRDKGQLLRRVEPVLYATSMCVMSVWPHYHRLLGNGLVGRVSGDSGPKISHVPQSLRTLLLSHFVTVWLLLPPRSPLSSSLPTLSHYQPLKPQSLSFPVSSISSQIATRMTND